MHLRHIAPAGTPIAVRDFAGWAGARLRGENSLAQFCEAVSRRFDVAHCLPVSSGRAALVVILEVLRQRHPERDEVVVPSYTCYSVAASAVKAGLKVRVCDIEPDTLSYDLDALRKLDFSRVLAVVSANLYGLPDRMSAIEALVRERGAYLIDDAAQAMGAQVDGRYSGSFGDVGIYSLDKGKNITSMQGGLIVTRSDALAEPLRHAVEALPATPAARALSYSAQLAAYALLLRPSLYWIPDRLLDLGATVYTTDYPVARYSPALAGMALRLFARLDALTEQRRRNAGELLRQLSDLDGLAPIGPPANATGVYVRLPVLVPGSRRDAVVEALQAEGIGASGSYPRSIQDVPELAPHLRSDRASAEIGRDIASRIVTLPTHPYVTGPQVAHMAAVVRRTLGVDRAASAHKEFETVRGL